jgi:hypothetical protein
MQLLSDGDGVVIVQGPLCSTLIARFPSTVSRQELLLRRQTLLYVIPSVPQTGRSFAPGAGHFGQDLIGGEEEGDTLQGPL